MTAAAPPAPAPRPKLRQRFNRAVPLLLLAPGLLWLLLFYVLPVIQMFTYSISTGSIETGFTITFSADAYVEALTKFGKQFFNSILYGGLATLFAFLIGFPVAYSIAFRGGRYKNLILFLVIAPFFTSFLIRTISWKILLGDEGPILGPLKHSLGILPGGFSLLGTPIAQTAGLTYNFLPFMILPLYVALEKIDPKLIEAAADLYAGRWEAFRRITFPLALPGVFAGSLLTFELTDTAPRVNPDDLRPKPLGECRCGGFGIALIDEVMDDWRIEPASGAHGNRLILRKQLRDPGTDEAIEA
jgi:spermidine/putrescine transport system permease protein